MRQWVGRTEREDNRNRLLNAQRAQFEAQLRINEMLFELATGHTKENRPR